MNTVNDFQVDTKGSCLLCLSKTIKQLDQLTCRKLSRFFNVALPIPSGKMPSPLSLESTGVIVFVCKVCSSLLKQFGKLYQEWEMTGLKLNATVQEMHDVMKSAEEDKDGFQEYRKQPVITRSPHEIMNNRIANNFRKEIIQKCSVRFKAAYPIVQLVKVDHSNDKQPETREENKEADDHACSQNQNLQKIVRPVRAKNYFRCKICPRNFRSEQNRQFHMIEYHLTTFFSKERSLRVTPLQFQMTVYGLFKKSKLKSSRNPSKPFACTYCTMSHRHIKGVKLHMIKKHLGKLSLELQTKLRIPSEVYSKTASSLTVSSSSSSSFPSSKISKETNGSAGGRVNCPTCAKPFRNKRTLYVHAKLHTNEMPHKCTLCPLSFKVDARLKNHVVKSHLGDIFGHCKEENVPDADFEATLACLVKKNLRYLAHEKIFICACCSKKYRNKIYCEFHLITTHRHELGAKILGLKIS